MAAAAVPVAVEVAVLIVLFPPNMTCWSGWYMVYWAEVSPMLDASNESSARICMAGKGREGYQGDAWGWQRQVKEEKKVAMGAVRELRVFVVAMHNE